MKNYICVKQKLFSQDLGHYTSYGIMSDDTKYILNDVSCYENVVQEIVKYLNENDIPEDSVKDIAERYI